MDSRPINPSAEQAAAAGDVLVSVIIPVRDDPDGIRRVLACLAAQTLPRERFEVIIGDDGSRPELAPQAPPGDPRIRVVTGPARTSYAARNAAVGVARGSILAFCDSDCQPEPVWLEQGLEALTGADLVAGEVKFLAPAKPTLWSLLTIDMFLDQRRNVRLSRGVTANLLVRRQLFDDLSGFDESLPSGGDYDFVGRALECGAQLRHAPLATVGHPTMNLAGPFLRKVWRTNFWSGVRKARFPKRIGLMATLVVVPVLGVVIARRNALRPAFSLDRGRLRACSVRPRVRDEVLAIAALYLVVCYVAVSARTCGWLRGLRLLREGRGPQYAPERKQASLESSPLSRP